MTEILLAGAGAVGERAGRQLVDTPGVERVWVADRRPERAESLARLLGGHAQCVAFGEIPNGVRALATAVPGPVAVPLARAALRSGVPVAAIADDAVGIDALFGLDSLARSAHVAIVVGCALVPGLGEVLARHAADALTSADEVHVARVGAAGPACVASLRRARRDRSREWCDDAWVTPHRIGHELVWFPEPVGARECEIVSPGVELVHGAVPSARRVTVRAAEPPVRNHLLALLARKTTDDGWGAARVDVWGWRGDARAVVTYGMIERPEVAAGTVVAVTAARLAGLLPGIELRVEARGALGLGTLVGPPSFLAELARRGVKAATFEGVAVA